MTVCLISHFRNATHYLERYLAQVGELANLLHERGDTLTVIWGEGDSTDTTRQQLVYAMGYYTGKLINVSHGGPTYGSVVHPERFRLLAGVCGTLWRHLPQNADAVVFCESDLVWDPETLLALIDRLDAYPAIAPMIMAQDTNRFYDIWAGRKNGRNFQPYPPYFDGWPTGEPAQVDSMGSCLAMRGEIARQVTWPETDVIVGVCRQIYELGGSVWLDCSQVVTHP